MQKKNSKEFVFNIYDNTVPDQPISLYKILFLKLKNDEFVL